MWCPERSRYSFNQAPKPASHGAGVMPTCCQTWGTVKLSTLRLPRNRRVLSPTRHSSRPYSDRCATCVCDSLPIALQAPSLPASGRPAHMGLTPLTPWGYHEHHQRLSWATITSTWNQECSHLAIILAFGTFGRRRGDDPTRHQVTSAPNCGLIARSRPKNPRPHLTRRPYITACLSPSTATEISNGRHALYYVNPLETP